jgi:hypothetical protein
MEEEYIIKLKDPVELIPKDQWDENIDYNTFGFIPLGPGIYKEITDDGYNPRIENEYLVLIGIAYNLKDESDSSLIYLHEYKNEKEKYSANWIRSIKGALKYEVTFLLKSKELKDALDLMKKIVSDPEEFGKIVKSMALAYILYRETLDENIKPLFDIKNYYYTLYNHILKGNLDYETYLEITKVNDAIIELDKNYIYGLEIRFERAYEKMKNRN